MGQLAIQFLRQCFGDFISGHADGFAGIVQSVLDDSTTLFLAKNDSDGRVFILLANLSVQRGQIKLHLTDKLWLEFPYFQFDGHQAAQPPVKKQQIDKKLFPIDLQPILTAHEGKHTAHGTQKILYPGNERLFHLALAVLIAQFQKIKGIFVPHRQFGLNA